MRSSPRWVSILLAAAAAGTACGEMVTVRLGQPPTGPAAKAGPDRRKPPAAYVIEVQARYDLPVNGSWVSQFDRVATVSWLAVLFLGADATLALLHGRAGRRAASAR